MAGWCERRTRRQLPKGCGQCDTTLPLGSSTALSRLQHYSHGPSRDRSPVRTSAAYLIRGVTYFEADWQPYGISALPSARDFSGAYHAWDQALLHVPENTCPAWPPDPKPLVRKSLSAGHCKRSPAADTRTQHVTWWAIQARFRKALVTSTDVSLPVERACSNWSSI